MNELNFFEKIVQQVVEYIQNKEIGYSVRAKLNAIIHFVNNQAATKEDVEKLRTPYFSSESKLNVTLPNAAEGSKAWVGAVYPGTVWIVENGKWKDTGVIPSAEEIDLTEYTQNGGLNKTLQQLNEELADRTVSGTQVPSKLSFRNGLNSPDTSEFEYSARHLTNWKKLPIMSKFFSASVNEGYQFVPVYFNEFGERITNPDWKTSVEDYIHPTEASHICIMIRRSDTRIINVFNEHGFTAEGLFALEKNKIITESDIKANKTTSNMDEIELKAEVGDSIDLKSLTNLNMLLTVDTEGNYNIAPNSNTFDSYLIAVNQGDTFNITAGLGGRGPQAILFRSQEVKIENIIYPLISASSNPLLLRNVQFRIPQDGYLLIQGRNQSHTGFIEEYRLRLESLSEKKTARTYTAKRIDELLENTVQNIDIKYTNQTFDENTGTIYERPDKTRFTASFKASKTVKVWVKDGYEFMVGRWDSVGNFLFADLGFSFRNQFMVLPKFEGEYKTVLRRTDKLPMEDEEISNLVFESDNIVNFDWWEVPEQPNDFEELAIDAPTFLAQYFDPYLIDEERKYDKIGEWDVNQWLPYTFVKNDLGKEHSGEYNIYEYVFTPKRYNKTIMLSSLLHGIEIVTGFAMARFFHYLFNEREAHPIFDYIYNNVRIISIPVLNPWGFSQVPRIYGNANGNVQINNNFDEHGSWNNSTGSSKPGDPWWYKGSAPWSEVETRIMRDWLNKYKNDALFWIDCHTGKGWDQDVWAYYVDTDGWLKPRMIEASAWLSKILYSEVKRPLKNLIQDRWTSEKLHYAYRMLGIPCMTIEHVSGRYGGKEGGSRDMQVYLRSFANYIISYLNNKPYGLITEDVETLKNQMAKAMRDHNERIVWDEAGGAWRLSVDSATGNVITQKLDNIKYNPFDREPK